MDHEVYRWSPCNHGWNTWNNLKKSGKETWGTENQKNWDNPDCDKQKYR